MLKLALALSPFLFVAACGGGTNAVPVPEQPQPETPAAPIRVNLNELTGSDWASPVGLTVAPDDGTIYYLDAASGIYEYDVDGNSMTQVVPAATLYAIGPDSGFTDIAAMGNGDFAITAMNDGFLYESATGEIRSYFCYVPGWVIEDPRPLIQLTNSVAWDAPNRQLIAQPITVDSWTNENIQSEVGTFPETGGEGTDWHPIGDPEFSAGASTVDNGTIWLGCDDRLYEYDLETDALIHVQSLERFSISKIDGMAFTAAELMVLDSATNELVRIPRELLETETDEQTALSARATGTRSANRSRPTRRDQARATRPTRR